MIVMPFGQSNCRRRGEGPKAWHLKALLTIQPFGAANRLAFRFLTGFGAVGYIMRPLGGLN